MRLGTDTEKRKQAYKALFEKSQSRATVKSIRDAVQKDLALGSDRFKREIEVLYGRRVSQDKAGRPIKGGR